MILSKEKIKKYNMVKLNNLRKIQSIKIEFSLKAQKKSHSLGRILVNYIHTYLRYRFRYNTSYNIKFEERSIFYKTVTHLWL